MKETQITSQTPPETEHDPERNEVSSDPTKPPSENYLRAFLLEILQGICFAVPQSVLPLTLNYSITEGEKILQTFYGEQFRLERRKDSGLPLNIVSSDHPAFTIGFGAGYTLPIPLLGGGTCYVEIGDEVRMKIISALVPDLPALEDSSLLFILLVSLLDNYLRIQEAGFIVNVPEDQLTELATFTARTVQRARILCPTIATMVKERPGTPPPLTAAEEMFPPLVVAIENLLALDKPSAAFLPEGGAEGIREHAAALAKEARKLTPAINTRIRKEQRKTRGDVL